MLRRCIVRIESRESRWLGKSWSWLIVFIVCTEGQGMRLRGDRWSRFVWIGLFTSWWFGRDEDLGLRFVVVFAW